MNTQQSEIPDPGTDPAKVGAAMQQEVTITQKALTQLKALPEPAGDQATLQVIWSEVANTISLAQQEATALDQGNTTLAGTLDDQLTTTTDKANSDSTASGLTVCGQS